MSTRAAAARIPDLFGLPYLWLSLPKALPLFPPELALDRAIAGILTTFRLLIGELGSESHTEAALPRAAQTLTRSFNPLDLPITSLPGKRMNIITPDEYFANLPHCIKMDWLPQRLANLGWNFQGANQNNGWLSVLGEDPRIWRERVWRKSEIDFKSICLTKSSERTVRELLLTCLNLPPNEGWIRHQAQGKEKVSKIREYIQSNKKFPSYIFGNIYNSEVFLVDGYHRYTTFRMMQKEELLDDVSTTITFYSGELPRPN